ncbi:unnamed protein product, partial [Polarella glacialis]
YAWIRAVDLLGRALRCPSRKLPEWEDIQATCRGQIKPHVPLSIAEGSVDETRCQRLLLNGSWRFRLFDSPTSATSDSPERVDFDDSTWDEVRVPSHWQLTGHATPIYT